MNTSQHPELSSREESLGGLPGVHPAVDSTSAHAEIAFDRMIREAGRRAPDSAILPMSREELTAWFEHSFGTVRRLSSLESRAARAIVLRHVARFGLTVRAFVFRLVDALEAHALALDAVPKPTATQTGVVRHLPHDLCGTVWATLGGHQVALGTDAVKSWLLADGRFVAWSGLDGSGGFENEGQSLRIHDTSSGRTHKVMAERFEVDRVTSHQLSTGQWAVLVEMSDGALDGDHFAVIDPQRGETFFAKMAVRVALEGDLLTLGYLQAAALQLPPDERAPYRTQAFDLKSLLDEPILRRPSIPGQPLTR